MGFQFFKFIKIFNVNQFKTLNVVESGLVMGKGQSQLKRELHEKKLLSIWLDRKGIIYFEMLRTDAIINA